ncbi:MAG: hypothetical protein KAV87_34990 [Desulfobacteraceae bacterium]|nr:hypothetical protein [Desulfobacteraceae bacterium]
MGKKLKIKSQFVTEIKTLSDEELFCLRAALEVEMRHRGVAFSIGDIGEKLAIDYFNSTSGLPNLKAAPTGTKNVDALSRNGEQYSIKTQWKAKKTGTIYPDNSNKNKQLFEYLLIVHLNDKLALKEIYEFSWEQFVKARSWDKRMNAWYIGCSNKNLQLAQSLKCKDALL